MVDNYFIKHQVNPIFHLQNILITFAYTILKSIIISTLSEFVFYTIYKFIIRHIPNDYNYK